MTSEIRANTIKNRVGLGTVNYTNTGIVVSGIVTANSFSGTGDLDVDGHTNLDNLSIAGVTTTTGSVNVGDDLDVTDDLTIGGEFNMIGSSDSAKYFDVRTGASNSLHIRSSLGGASNLVTMLSIGRNGSSFVGNLTLGDSSDTSSAAGPEFTLNRNSSSPANADYLGQIKFAGRSSTGVQRNYAKITGKILDVTNGTEDGILEFAHIKGGSQTITGRWRSDSLQLLNDTNLSVAGDTTLTGDLDVDGHTNLDNVSVVGVTTITANNVIGLNVENSSGGGAQTTIRSKSTVANASNFVRSESSDNKYIGLLKYGTGHSAYGALAAGGGAVYANSSVPITIMSDGGYINFATGGNTEKLRIDATGRVLIGIDATTNNDSYLQAFKPTGNDATITVGNVATSASGLCRYDFAPSNKVVGSRIECHASEDFSTSANRTADLVFITRKDGTLSEKLRISSGGQVNIGGDADNLTQTTYPFSVSGSTGGNNQINIVQRIKYSGASNQYNTGVVIAFTNTETNANAYSYIGARIDSGSSGANANALVFATNATNTAPIERLRIDSTGVARFINSTGELKIASSTGNDGGKIILQENTLGAWSLEAQRANGYFRISDEYNGGAGSPQEYFRISTNGRVSISDDGTTDGLLTIKGNSDATSNPSIRLLDGSDTREVSITNTSGDFIASTHGTDNVAHGSIKVYDSGIIALSTNSGAGNAERLRVDLNGGVRHMGTAGYWQITVIHNGSGSGNWYSGSAPQRIYPNYIDNRTGYAEFLIEFNPSVSYSGWQEPTFVICGGSGGLQTGGTIELNMNRRTNAPNNAVFRSYHGQFSWQIYNDGDGDVTAGQREINRNVEHRSSYWIDPSTQSVDYIHSTDSRYNTNAEPLINQRSFIKIKMNNSSNTSYAIQGHPFICRFVTYRQGDDNWFAYMQYN